LAVAASVPIARADVSMASLISSHLLMSCILRAKSLATSYGTTPPGGGRWQNGALAPRLSPWIENVAMGYSFSVPC
jgi:hypothetical protein